MNEESVPGGRFRRCRLRGPTARPDSREKHDRIFRRHETLSCSRQRTLPRVIGVAVLTNNLMKIAELLIRRDNKKKPRTRAA